MPAPTPEAVVQEALSMYAAGCSIKETTAATGLAWTTVFNYARRRGLPLRPRRRPYKNPPDAPYRTVKHGYIVAWAPQHPYRGHRRSAWVAEHVRVMELHLGRPLEYPREVVHHKNHDKQDNRIENLEIQDRREHSRHHKLLEHSQGKPYFGGRPSRGGPRDPLTGRYLPRSSGSSEGAR